jgi:lipopolysaccharide transport system ATP-binding protein
MSSAAIRIENVGKSYQLGGGGESYRTLRDAIGSAASVFSRKSRQKAKQPNESFWAVKDISFDVRQGEVIGIIGRNGAGKSTLLKILSRITEPTHGSVRIRGRVGSLLEVGTGFHHELSGRENIYLNGAILGMSRREIAARFDQIVDFAGVERFLDTPVKRYSSGMFVRLAFAVASHLEPEVLIVDEVLAVGDAAFQQKCLNRMSEVSRSGRTVLVVSHNMASIMNLCQRVAVLERGELDFVGDTEEGVRRYLQRSATSSGSSVNLENHVNRRSGCKPLLGGVTLKNSLGAPTDQFLCGEPLVVEMALGKDVPPGEYHFAVGVDDTLGQRLFTAATYLSESFGGPDAETRVVQCRIDELRLAPGRYALSFNAGPREWVWTDFIEQGLWLDVHASDYYGNGRLPKSEWGAFLVRSQWNAGEHVDAVQERSTRPI